MLAQIENGDTVNYMQKWKHVNMLPAVTLFINMN